jgi:hypothetical protein
MLAPSRGLYPRSPDSLWALFHLRDPEACERLHEQRTHWRGFSDLAAFGPRPHDTDFVPGTTLEVKP